MKKKRGFCDPWSPLNQTLLKMKLTVFILLLSIMGALASNGYSQVNKLTLNVKDVRVEDFLRLIENQSLYRFFYSGEINVDQKMSGDFTNATIDEILDKALESKGIKYEITGRQVILSSATISVSNQQKTVYGQVSDSSGQPLPGVSVVVKGTTTGTITDFDGKYTLANVPGDATLVFSFVGMRTQEITVAGKTSLNVKLVEDAIGIEEVVAIGYGTQKKVNLTGSISSVKTEEFQNIPVANLSNAMSGRAPGVQVIGNTGLAGASADVRIRGSFAEPLYVINGVLKNKSDFDALDANEVESINFLKDAASSSIYGSSAGNGVVLVTTKGGTVQKPKFEYRTSYSTSRTTLPIQDYTATEQLEYENNVAVTKGLTKPNGQELFDYFKDKSYSINDLIWQNPSTKQHNISVNGGSEAVTYYLGLGYHSEEGSYKNLNYDKYNFRSDVTARITKRFKVNVNLSGNQRNYHRWYWKYDGAEDFNVGDFYRSTFNWTRLYPFYADAQGNPTNDPNDYPVVPAGYHPAELILNSGAYNDIKYRTLDGIIRFDLDLGEYVDGLSTSFQAQVTSYDKNMKSFAPGMTFYVIQPASTTNRYIPGPIDFSKTITRNLQTYERVEESVDLYSSYQYNWYINYQKKIGKHDISAVAVYEQLGSNSKNINGNAEELLSSSIDQIFNASSDTERRWFSGSESEFARQSYIGRVHYGFTDKYIVEFSFRYDGNYKFAPEKRWGFFPSGSAAWRISEENFMKDIVWLSNLKLRGSYGTTGSDSGIAAWKWTNVYNKTTGYVFGSSLQNGLQPGAIPNPDLTWSRVSLWDIGLEYGMFDNRLSGELDIWAKTESDILGSRLGSTPSTFGGSLPAVNYAQRSWKGYEFSVNWSDRKGSVKYQVYANMGYAVDQWDIYDEVAALTDGTYLNNWRSTIGKPANRLSGYISKGIIRTQEELDAIPEGFTQFGRVPMLGVLLFEDIRGTNYSEGPDGKIDSNDLTYLSDDGAPRINYGFGFNMEWKGITINTHFQGVGAYDRMIQTRNGSGVFQVERPYFELWARGYWTPETPDAKLPRVGNVGTNQPEFGAGASSFWIRNGAYLRLKNLNIGYTLPTRWYAKLGVSKVQFFINGTNLFVLSALKEHDPEQKTLDSYPLMKDFTAGLNINF